MKVNVELLGMERAVRALEGMKRRARGNLLVDTAREGAKPILERARELAPRRTGQLAKKGLQIKRTRRRMEYGEVAVTNTRAGSHAVLLEFGTKPHEIRQKMRNGRERIIRHPGTRKRPFLRPAFDEKLSEAQRRASSYFVAELLKALRKS